MKKIISKIVLAVAAGMILAVAFSGNSVQAATKTMADGGKFDAAFYASSYPDVVAVLGKSEKVLYNHYKAYGKAEGRLPYAGAAPEASAFDAAYYAARYPDVVKAMGSDPAMLKLHYDLAGKAEGRFANQLEETQKTTAAATTITPAQAATAAAAPAAGVTLASLPSSYMAISTDLTLAGAGNGYHGKVVLKTATSAISFGIQYDLYGAKPYNGKAIYICENVGSNAIGGQVYTRHGLAPLGQTVNIMEAYDTATGMCYLYVNGQLVGQVANTFLKGQNVTACVEIAGRDDGSSVMASFANIRFKKAGTSATNGDSVMFTRVTSSNPGMTLVAPGANAYQYRTNYNATAQGTIVGLNGLDWDNAYYAVSATAEFAMYM